MKRLLILAALATLAASSLGCRCGWFNRGPACNTAPVAAAPACATPSYGAPVYSGAPVYDPQPGL
jgi:hypothetical protein